MEGQRDGGVTEKKRGDCGEEKAPLTERGLWRQITERMEERNKGGL